MNTISISYTHLFRLSDECGIFEHAKFTTPRTENGYCVDDVARALVVAVREPEPTEQLLDNIAVYLNFIVAALNEDGSCHNRRGTDRSWQDEPSLEDHWGRALWALGSVVARKPDLAQVALAHFTIGARRRSPFPRAMAFAALGAAEVLRVEPGNTEARELLASATAAIGPPTRRLDWRWPEPRLHYANAVLAEALLAVGTMLPGQGRVYADGLAMLRWLLEIETSGDHLSVTPVDGWTTGETRPGFDQQPIEVATLADACARAYDDTGDQHWKDAVLLCEAWFRGTNDVDTPLIDPASGGCCDGLEHTGRNENQGAESTLALISTQQQARRLTRTP
ncbi:glycosyltransferase [Nocardia sp. NBC_00565]|uniref:glycosyltransferase n=1 Tax=Nocardia sp. NBC_00565 TaxID=2975993 RepID=UPI002E80DEE4|nr:glycosyltransferase [Nocardia sp. NBC_00565]WUC00975.1 glycosyltransferase [Nocardia sp. NBC_00565]